VQRSCSTVAANKSCATRSRTPTRPNRSSTPGTYRTRLVEDTVARFGRLDVLVNNAGFAIFGPFAELTTADWRRQLATDLDGVYFGAREALPHLLKTRGSIANLSSASGLGADWGGSGYNAAKGAVPNVTRSLALEYAARGVRVTPLPPA
jgi:meso-butanediol dehydrogenase/(S,S)-butanediol dehydrogenase/diacetyl reductase